MSELDDLRQTVSEIVLAVDEQCEKPNTVLLSAEGWRRMALQLVVHGLDRAAMLRDASRLLARCAWLKRLKLLSLAHTCEREALRSMRKIAELDTGREVPIDGR